MPRREVVIGDITLALDARPDRLDLRDRRYIPRLGNLPDRFPDDRVAATELPAYVDAGLVLNQGGNGACTGFGLAAVINYLRFTRTPRGAPHEQVSPAMLYELARVYDEWPGEGYEGSSCRGALKGWHRHGVCRDRLWEYILDEDDERVFKKPAENPRNPLDPDSNWDRDALGCTLGVYYRVDARSIVDMQAAILETGAIYVSATVHEGWGVATRRRIRNHDDLVRIRHVPKPKDPGGHAFALVGYNETGFVVQNSWGSDWGSIGFALLPYEDWVGHGEDAWVLTLGVPRLAPAGAKPRKGKALRSPRFFVPSSTPGADAPVGSSVGGGAETAVERPIGLVTADDAFTRRYRSVPRAVQPLDNDDAYRHAIVLDRGFPVRNDISEETAETALQTAVERRPLQWLQDRKSNKLLIYAHGGLNSESASISRIRAIAPYALDNGIYPLFITWRSGSLETVSDIVEEYFSRFGLGAPAADGWLDRITEKTDRLLEPALRAPGGAAWSQMKLNAQRASEHAAGGGRLLVASLRKLAAQRPNLEIHLIGHSAGAIVLGAMLKPLKQAGLSVASLRLFAPACTARFALDHYAPAVKNRTLDPKRWFVHVLSDRNELNDNVGPYRKSLLYLVSRSFEDTHKTPIIGLDNAFDQSTVAANVKDGVWASDHMEETEEWIKFWAGLGTDDTNRVVLEKSSVSNGVASIKASHGCFDNAVDIIGGALGYIVNPRSPTPVKVHKLDY